MSFNIGDPIIVHGDRFPRSGIYAGEFLVLTVSKQKVIWVNLNQFENGYTAILDQSYLVRKCKFKGHAVYKRACSRMYDTWRDTETFMNWCVFDINPDTWQTSKMLTGATVGFYLAGLPGAAIGGYIGKNYL